MNVARDKLSVPQKVVISGQFQIENELIDWLLEKKLGWEPAYAQQLVMIFKV